MSKPKKYGTYDPWIKSAIASTGRIDLFPNLKIPRMTALHWIKQGYKVDDPTLESMTAAIIESRLEQDKMQQQFLEAQATTQLLKGVTDILGYKLRWRHVDSTEIRNKVLDAIEIAMLSARRDVCLEILDLSLSRYKRWRSERRGCGLPMVKTCPKGSRVNQLTFQEIQTMREYVTSKRFAHYPILSLHFYTKREGTLFCTYSTWQKYIAQYKWLRPRKRKTKKTFKVGIRAKKPNEIWHMDLSYFILPNKQKLYIQAIIDNYSRYVLAWQVLESYDGSKTAALLEQALKKARGSKIRDKKLRLIVDGGSENNNSNVKEVENQGDLKKQVARFEISFSNSMIEAVFRSMKHNYLFSQNIRNFKTLVKHVNFWFKEHNDVMPHTAFNGETPNERFNSIKMTKEDEVRILIKHEDAIKLRIKHNQKVFCQMCEVA